MKYKLSICYADGHVQTIEFKRKTDAQKVLKAFISVASHARDRYIHYLYLHKDTALLYGNNFHKISL